MSRPEPRRWWLKIETSFYSTLKIKMMRRKVSEAAVTIYIKMMLASLENDFCISYQQIEGCDSFAEEIAVRIDEEQQIEEVQKTIDYLRRNEMMVEQDAGRWYFPHAAALSGSEGASAERMRNKRQRDKNGTPSQDDASGDG